MVEEHGAAFDAVNLATAMHRVAKLQPPNADLVIRDPIFQRLTGDRYMVLLEQHSYTRHVVCERNVDG